ncbi:MAG: hypothetical protein IJ007_06300 [Oscillospiraceae bacterium]|nr:hypothetical protein [Oscillospiraceae bacterium]
MNNKSLKKNEILSLIASLGIIVTVVLSLILIDIDMNNAAEQGKNDAYNDMKNQIHSSIYV